MQHNFFIILKCLRYAKSQTSKDAYPFKRKANTDKLHISIATVRVVRLHDSVVGTHREKSSSVMVTCIE